MATTEMKCINCIYFKPADMTGSSGDCKRYPPVVVFDAEETLFLSAFPSIDSPSNNYCGEFAIPEELL